MDHIHAHLSLHVYPDRSITLIQQLPDFDLKFTLTDSAPVGHFLSCVQAWCALACTVSITVHALSGPTGLHSLLVGYVVIMWLYLHVCAYIYPHANIQYFCPCGCPGVLICFNMYSTYASACLNYCVFQDKHVCIRSMGCNSLWLRAVAPGRESCGSGRSQQGSEAQLGSAGGYRPESMSHWRGFLEISYWEASRVKTVQCHHVLLLAAMWTPQ